MNTGYAGNNPGSAIEGQAEDLTVNLAIRVTPSMLLALRLQAQEEDRPVGWLVRKAITDMLSTKKEG